MYASNRYEREPMRIPPNYGGNAFPAVQENQQESSLVQTERMIETAREEPPAPASPVDAGPDGEKSLCIAEEASVSQEARDADEGQTPRTEAVATVAAPMRPQGIGQEELLLMALLLLLRGEGDGHGGGAGELWWLLLFLLLLG